MIIFRFSIYLIFLVLLIQWAAFCSNNNGATAEEGTYPRRSPVVVAVEKVGPAVANLSTERVIAPRYIDPFFGSRNELFDRFFEDFFGSQYPKERVERPLGSGVIIDEDGYIVTDEHVVSRATKIKVTLSDRSEFEATVVSSDSINDLAVLKVNAPKPLPFVKMGTSNDLMIGETVIALGNPFGLENSVTTGVLSAINRKLTFGEMVYEDLIQTDASINPGNSGGPLVNINGELIGINTAIVDQAQGIGFSIPVDKVRQTLAELLNFEEINKIWFGAKVEDSKSGAHGVTVTSVDDGSPAEKAGLKKDDIIAGIDSKPINDVLDFRKNILKRNVNDTLNILIVRDGVEHKAHITLAKTPVPSVEKLAKERFGIEVQELTTAIAKQLRLWWIKGGVLISGVEQNSPAGDVGINPGYVIVRLGRYRINNMNELGITLNQIRRGDFVDVGLAWSDATGEHQGYARLRAR
ncbi:MAG TPA: trypsin-like peptidase domain-containing protein [Candidatus Brocadiia bacterium]|nr:trypsin-like peptidase domain-containing protein [Candidatus Brocadiales bacterium]